VAGNKKGSVGVGQGKASDTPLAIEKAFRDAKKNMIIVNTTKEMSIPHEVTAKFNASRVKIMPLRGKGILAGSSVRTVLELAGLREIGAKLFSRSKNSANNAYVAIKALKQLEMTKIRERTPLNFIICKLKLKDNALDKWAVVAHVGKLPVVGRKDKMHVLVVRRDQKCVILSNVCRSYVVAVNLPLSLFSLNCTAQLSRHIWHRKNLKVKLLTPSTCPNLARN
jgi:small subunit ribosomal protein S5